MMRDVTTMIQVIDGTGHREVPAVWLRMHCPCEACMLIEIGERRVMVTSRDDWAVESVDQGDDHTSVAWASGHRSRYDAAFLASMQAKADRRRWSPSHWGADHVVAEIDHDTFVHDRQARIDALLRYRAEGVLVLRGVPTTGTPSEDFLDAIRIPIWEGPFGLRSIDTRVQAKAYNVAETAEALPPHSDLAGYQWPPSGQMLHMLVNEATGGDSLVVDSWRILAGFRADEPEAFEVLTQVPVAHRIFSEDRETYARAPIIRLDTAGEVNGFRFSNQTLQPLSLDEPRLTEWYEAYTSLAARITAPGQAATFRLETGDAYLTHAHRVLHARTAFEASGDRCIRDVYFEFDNVLAEIDRLTGDNP